MKESFGLPCTGDRKGPRRVNILALTGGGYRGLFTARVLAKLQEEMGEDKALAESFDLIAGTSIGGVIACALAAGISPARIDEALQEFGPLIFGGRVGRLSRTLRWGRRLISAGYSAVPLKEALRAILGDQAKRELNSIEKPLLLVAVSHTNAATALLRSAGLANAGRPASDVTLLDAALATAAAPTYFPAHWIKPELFLDGGLVANAPDLVALTEAMVNLFANLDEIHLLSVGTAGEAQQRVAKKWLSPGMFGWMIGQRLFDLTIAAQEQLAISQAETLLQDRMLRIDARPSPDQQEVVALDRADQTARDTLLAIAEQAVKTILKNRNQALRDFLRHRSENTRR